MKTEDDDDDNEVEIGLSVSQVVPLRAQYLLNHISYFLKTTVGVNKTTVLSH